MYDTVRKAINNFISNIIDDFLGAVVVQVHGIRAQRDIKTRRGNTTSGLYLRDHRADTFCVTIRIDYTYISPFFLYLQLQYLFFFNVFVSMYINNGATTSSR